MKNKDQTKSIWQKIYRVLSGFEIAIVCLSLLLLLTFFGTLEQKPHGLYQTSKKYFDIGAFFLRPEVQRPDGSLWKLPLLLPGTYWVSVVLFFNMFLGGVIRIRKKSSTLGVLISHFGILFMLFAGFVSSLSKKEAMMLVYEGERSDYAQSYHEPTIEVFEYSGAERGKPWVLPSEPLKAVSSERPLQADFPELPFSMKVTHYFPACEIKQARRVPDRDPAIPVVDGFFLEPQKRGPEEELNLQGCYVDVYDREGELIRPLLLWVGNTTPVSFLVDGKKYGALMPREVWPMPFEVHLEKSLGEKWPGTSKAKWFQSNIIKVTGEQEDEYEIVMNEPMRHGGFTLYQARWDKPQGRAFSGFAIVSNPSDQWPKYSLFVVTFGLLIHFLQMLLRYSGRAMNTKES